MYFADAHNDLPSRLLNEQPYIGIDKLWEAGARFQVFSIYCHRPRINEFVDALCQIRLLNKYMQQRDVVCLREGICNDIINKDKFTYTILLEGAELLGKSPDNIRLFIDLGVRIVGLTCNNYNGYCGNSHDSAKIGLTDSGRELIERLNQHKVAIDLSHASSIAFNKACEVSETPCMASHSNIYSVEDNVRNLSDDNIRLLKESGGYIGLCFYRPFLGRSGDIEQLFRHIDYCMELGCENILGFGSDFNGTDDIASELMLPNAYNNVVSRMIKAGYKEEVIQKITHHNLINYLKKFN